MKESMDATRSLRRYIDEQIKVLIRLAEMVDDHERRIATLEQPNVIVPLNPNGGRP